MKQGQVSRQAATIGVNISIVGTRPASCHFFCWGSKAQQRVTYCPKLLQQHLFYELRKVRHGLVWPLLSGVVFMSHLDVTGASPTATATAAAFKVDGTLTDYIFTTLHFLLVSMVETMCPGLSKQLHRYDLKGVIADGLDPKCMRLVLIETSRWQHLRPYWTLITVTHWAHSERH